MKRTDVLIVGAGQAGLALSACLSRRGVDHALLERGGVAESWRVQTWQGLRLLTPNWMTRLPGFSGGGDDPVGFMDRDAVVGMLRSYAQSIAAPVEADTRVIRLAADGRGFRIATDRGPWTARAVVIATGACHWPAAPDWAAALDPSLVQVLPTQYRCPADLPAGGVLVVGASATGAQFAREINASGRPVTMAVGRHTRLPRRYRGRDIMEWLDRAGVLDEPSDRPPAARLQTSLQLSGRPDEADLGLPWLAAEGVRLVGRAVGGSGTRIGLRPDLAAACAASELRRRRTLARIDAHAALSAPEAPADPAAWEAPRLPASDAAELDLAAEGVRTVVWATGYRRVYPWLRLPALDRRSEIAHRGGVTAVPGLFALGLPFLRRRSSTLIDGVGRDAEALAPLIAAHLAAAPSLAA